MTVKLKEEDLASVYAQSIHESLPPYSATAHVTNCDDDNKDDFRTRVARTWTHVSTMTRIGPGISTASQSTGHFWNSWAAPAVEEVRLNRKKQSIALVLLSIFGIIPFASFGWYERVGNVLFRRAFATKVQSCDYAFSSPDDNSTVRGAEALFVLDVTSGQFTFAEAKAIDVAWDFLVGHGVQLLVWTVSYMVFSDALVRLVERHPAPFQVFKRIALEGPSLNSAWALLKELFKRKSKRTWALFFYMLLSTIYVLSIPAFLSAMTGYDSRTIPWVSIGPDENNIIPASYLNHGYMVMGTWNTTFAEPTCAASTQLQEWTDLQSEKQRNCDCEFPDGKRVTSEQWVSNVGLNDLDSWLNYTRRDCQMNYTGNTQTYEDHGPTDIKNCNQTMVIKLGDAIYSAYSLNYTYGFCWNDKGYDSWPIQKSSRCLPDTANPSYEWGFSTTIVAIFLIVHFVWALSMYFIWLDAQLNSELVKSGFRLTELGAAFLVTEAAKKWTGLEGDELIQMGGAGLKRELYGSRRREGAVVDKDVFGVEGMKNEEMGRLGMVVHEDEELYNALIQHGSCADTATLGAKYI